MNIKKILFLTLLITSACYAHALSQDVEDYSPQEGDLIFQTETLPQGFAIQAATASRYNHVGIIFKKNEKYYVYEAIGKVQATPLSGFVSRNATHGRFTVMRSKEALSNSDISSIKKEVYSHLGKRYDGTLGWSDSKMYCSELIWKAYMRGADISLSKPLSINERPMISILEKFIDSQFDLPNVNRESPIVSPADIARSSSLETIFTNY